MEQKKQKKNGIYQTVVDQITGIFFPVINIITAASMIKSAIVLLGTFGVVSTQSGVYQIFYAVSDGFFFFLPFFLAITASKQWNTDLYISLLIPVAMLYPDITAILENGKTLSFLGLTVPSTVYHSSVIPVLMAIGLLHFVEKPCDKYIGEAVRGFLKPIICCLIVLPVTFLLFGPMGTWIGDILTKIFFALYDWNSVVAGAFMGFFMQPMVVVGAHWSVVPVSISNVANYGYDVIMPLVGGAVYAQAGAALAVGILCKHNKEKRQVAFQASLTAALGVTEPALFGVNVPMVRPMIAACLAGAVGGAMVGAAGTHCTSFAFPSYLTCVAYVGPGFVTFLLSMAVSFVLGFIFTMVQKKYLFVAQK
ncbi:MAG: PTS transporter subunit EIIC [Eubacteriales bacterium]|nr:PTS transporter subunit EIIC [Eubacteriales bacterium]